MQIDLPKGDSRYDFHRFLNYDYSDDFTLSEIGAYRNPPSYYYGPSVRPRPILHYIVSGKGFFILRGKRYEVTEKQMFYIPANEVAYYQADEEDPWYYIWLHIQGSKLPDLLQRAGVTPESPIYQPLEKNTIVDQILIDLIHRSDSEFYCHAKIYEMFDALIANSANKSVDQVEQQLFYVRKIIHYIHLHSSTPMQITWVAEACGLNRSYMTRLFKEATGQSVQEYLISYRMKMACNYLADPEKTIQYIAFSVGYSDVFTFSKAFKKTVGKSPSEYRKALLTQAEWSPDHPE